MDNVIATEESLIDEMRHRVKDDVPEQLFEDDMFFLRFIRARNHNIDAAENMLRNHMKFRKKYKVDTILADNPIDKLFTDTNYIPVTRLGTDLEGSPVTYLKFGHIDTRGTLKVVTYYDIQNFVVHYLERDREEMKERTKTSGKLIDKATYIFDFENFSLATATHKPTLEVFFNLLIMYEANYPETLKAAYGINISYVFTVLWALVKPFISGPTLKKIKLFGKTGWREDLLQYVSPDELPQFLGGNRTDPDGNPLCKTFVKQGGPIPESMFTTSHQSLANRIPGAKRLTVSRMSRSEVTSYVLHPGSTLEWEFAVKQHDIGFSLWRRMGDVTSEQEEELMPQRRVEATGGSTECGMYKCDKPGTYVIEFDNTYSWIHKKDIYYRVSVAPPHQQTFSS